MTQPSKFIASSDFASTPSSLNGAKEIVLTTPANVSVSALDVVNYSQSEQFDDDFDTINFIITCDELANINAYNDYVEISQSSVNLWVSVEIVGHRVSLVGSLSSLTGGTFTNSYTFRAVVIPIKSPYSQS